ncbi:MAG TPA: PAS domain S-box protein [Dongiaceae bacterium]|nr:PAS domain S-box protein [Dongiaceae bacterium]
MPTPPDKHSSKPISLAHQPIARRLQLVVFVFVCIVFAVLALAYAGSRIASASRAYMGGEAMWSKAQKTAVIRLQKYSASHDEQDYQAFLASLAVPFGDRAARTEMEKEAPDYAVIREGFRQGKIADDDIPGMISLYRRFHGTPEIAAAARIWAEGDADIEELRKEGAELHASIVDGGDAQQIREITSRIERTDKKLTVLGENFSAALSTAARRMDGILAIGLPLAASLLLALGAAISIIVVRQANAIVAERAHAEAIARANELRYRELLENASDIIYVHDLDGFFLDWNRKAGELLGYDLQEGRLHIRDLVAPEDRAAVEEMLARCVAGKNAPTHELRLVTKAGAKVEVEVSSRLLYEDGKMIGVQGIARDLSDRRKLEAELLQAQKMEAVGRLAGGIAHDFNNILMIVRGYAELLIEGLHPKDPLHAQAEQIQKAGSRGAELTQRLLGFSRKQVFEPKILDVNEAIREVSKMLPRLLGAHIEFGVALDPDAGFVNADPIQLEQVLINLVVNSRDAMPQGGRLTVRTASRDLESGVEGSTMAVVPGRYVEISVQDSGCGIEPSAVPFIFEPFFTTKEKDKGTGLGLSTVYGIVKRSGGYILVSTKAGVGTTMRVYLPQVEREADKPAGEPVQEPQTAATCTVLVADDEESLRTLISTKLRSEGYQVLEAANGEEAIAAANRHRGPIQLLLTDVIMPKLRGPEAAARLRLRYPGMKVIYMSGYTESALVQDGMLERDTVLLQKPFTITKIVETIQQLNSAVRT